MNPNKPESHKRTQPLDNEVGRVILNAPSVDAKCFKFPNIQRGGLGINHPIGLQRVARNRTSPC